MSNGRVYITTAIPYVNGDPHLGHALELVQADVLARHRRLRGTKRPVPDRHRRQRAEERRRREAAGVPVAEFVTEKAQRFVALAAALALSIDDFIRTSSDPRHRPGVERLWRACAAAGRPLPQGLRGPVLRRLRGVRTRPDELVGGRCPEHGTAAGAVVEEQLVLPPVALRGAVARPDRSAPTACRAGAPPQRGARVHRARPHGLQRLARRANARAAGASRCPATRSRSSTSGSTRSPTTSPRSATAPTRGRPTAAGGPKRRAASTSSARGSSASTPSTGRRSCSPPGSRCRRRSWCTTT